MTSHTKARSKALQTTERGRLLGVREAAEYLGISIWTMRARIWAGDIAFVRFPGCRKQLLDVRDLEKLIQNNKLITD